MITKNTLQRLASTMTGVIGAEHAEFIAVIIGQVVQDAEANDVLSVRIDRLALRLRATASDVLQRLRLADGLFAEATGIPIVEDTVAYDLYQPSECLSLDVSNGFSRLIRGDDDGDISCSPMPIEPDFRSKSDLELLRLSVESRACGAFLYRIDDRVASEELAEHVVHLARAYARHAPSHVVKVCGGTSSGARGEAVRSLLSAILHHGQTEILLIFGSYLAPAHKSVDTFDEEELGPSEKLPNAPILFTSEGDRILRLLPYLPATTVVPIATSAKLRTRDA